MAVDFRKRATYHEGPSPTMQSFGALCEDYGGELIAPLPFYREVFPPETLERYKSRNSEDEDEDGHRGNPLLLIQRGAWMYPDNRPNWAYGIEVKDELGEYHTRHTKRIIFDDYKWLTEWKGLPDVQHVWMSGLTYIGKSRDLAHAVSMHALIFDVDMESEKGLYRLLYGTQAGIYPAPNYIVLSGNGVHLYYTFTEPLPLYHGKFGRKVKSQVNALKMALTDQLWNPYTIDHDERGRKPQYQGINQAFRVVGSYTKSLDLDHNRYKVIAYKFPHIEPYEGVGELYRFVDIPKSEQYRERSIYGLDYWREKNPEWYERRIIKKDKTVKFWHMSRRLYEWWLRQVKEKAQFGHRYNCLFCVVVYAVKCDIPQDEVKSDLMDLLPILTSRKPDDPITEADVYEALKAYSDDLNTYPVKSVQYLSGIDLKSDAPRRNGQSQKDHLEEARAIRDIRQKRAGTDWRDGNGRKPKKDIVKAWRMTHPDGKKAQCIRDTGLSKPTVLKWWEKGDYA